MNASHNATQRPARPGFSWCSTVVALVLGFVFALSLGAPIPAAAQDEDSPFCLSVGKWGPRGPKGQPVDTVAWVDLATWRLVTDTGGIRPVTVLGPEPQPWIPVAGDFDGDGFDSIAMFNSQDWSLVDAEKGPVASRATEPVPVPWIPVAGDWDGDGRDTVLVVDGRDGSVHRLEEGPAPIERYDLQPQPWVPVAGDFDGDGIDTIATVKSDAFLGPEPQPWIPVAGDFDGDGIDSVGFLSGSTGELAVPAAGKSLDPQVTRSTSRRTPAAADKALQLPNGCYTTVKNKKTFWVPVPDGAGGFKTKEVTTFDQWYCCPISSTGGRYACSVKTVIL
jgi:hypothetical protein